MKAIVPDELERGRDLTTSTREWGWYGRFLVRCRATNIDLLLVVSGADADEWRRAGLPGPPWEHVSVSVPRKHRCPTWEEMCWVKDLVWEPEECVVQFHPPASEYRNFHPYCLHLWKPAGVEVPRPPAVTVAPEGARR